MTVTPWPPRIGPPEMEKIKQTSLKRALAEYINRQGEDERNEDGRGEDK